MVAAGRGVAQSDIARVPGWYGKLPSLGDFASRRLEGDFIEPWDLWLGERLQALRDARGEAWLPAYLHSRPWRFLLTPGALAGLEGSSTLAGVLLPSVDRVGRYFPLTLVASLPRVPAGPRALGELLAWLHRLEDAALDAVQNEWTIDALESALARLAPPGHEAAAPDEGPLAMARRELASALASRGGSIELAPALGREDIAGVIWGAMDPDAARSPALSHAAPELRRLGLWIADGPDRQRLLVSDGLPTMQDFFLMFGSGVQVPAPPVQPLIPADADLLGMFDTASAAAGVPPAPAGQGSEVLGLFAAPVVPPGAENDDTRPGDDDILALFDALPNADPASGEEKKSAEPDILDLFGARRADEDKAS
jgi:type VI secretion system protein ImpM